MTKKEETIEDNQDDTVVTGPEDVKETEEQEPEAAPEQEEDTPTGEEPEKVKEPESEQPAPEPIVINGKQYSEEDLDRILELGSDLYEYKKERPGFDYKKLQPEFTKRSQENAELKKENQELEAIVEKFASTLLEDDAEAAMPKIEGIAEADVEVVTKVLEGLGVKPQAVSKKESLTRVFRDFVEEHPEYSDAENQALLEAELSLYKTPDAPEVLERLLNRVHRSIAPTPVSNPDTVKRIAEMKRNRLSQSQSGGGAAAGTTDPLAGIPKDKQHLVKGLRGFSPEEIQRILTKKK